MLDQLYLFPILLFSVVIHEVAHGYLAWKLGDPTARDLGRLTLNPIPHLDLFGSVIIPLLSLLSAGTVFIAWAKPVPVNPANFVQPRRDDMLVAAVGPLSNILLAFMCSLAVILLEGLGGVVVAGDSAMAAQLHGFLVNMFYGGVYLNIILAVFNLIPVPPLDGSHMLAALLPSGIARQYRRIGFLGIIAIIVLMRVPAFNSLFYSIIKTVFIPFQMLMDTFV